MAKARDRKKPADIAVVGDVDDWEEDVVKALLELPAGSACVFYIDSAGGSVYGALAAVTVLRLRRLETTAIVIGECSSAALLLFAACTHRRVTRHSTMLFHRMRWQSDKRVGALEATRWARHFEEMERDIDVLQAKLFGTSEEQVRGWIEAGEYVTGVQMAAAGLAELVEIV